MTRFLLLVVLAAGAGCGGDEPKPAGTPADVSVFDKKATPKPTGGKGNAGPAMA